MILFLVLLPGVLGDYCGQFSNCEACAGRHHVTFEVCHWCPDSNSCVPASAQCKTGYRTAFDCPRMLSSNYNDSFARLVATPLIAAAQGSHDQMNQCIQRVEGKIQLWRRFYLLGEDGAERPDGFVAVDFTRRAVIVSFSSVASGAKLLYNRFSAEFFTNRQAQFEASNGLVNRLIYDSWFKIWYVLGMENAVRQVFQAHPDFELLIFGHAIGGAKADMTAVAVVLKNITTANKTHLMTFGATRVGDLSFVEMIETSVRDRFRVVHRNDMATKFPKEFDGEWTPPHHHRYEVWYPQEMSEGASFLVCLGAEDPQCSSRLPPWQLRAEDNDVYFERHMEQWALSGCDGNDRASKQSKFKMPTIPLPTYDMNALQTAKPYSTTAAPASLTPTQATPRITLPPRHLRPLEHTKSVSTTVPMTTTSTTTPATSTSQVYTLPWWYTTQPSSSTSATTSITTTTTTTISKDWYDGKSDGNVPVTRKTPAWFITTPPTFLRNSFRAFRFFQKGQKFRPLHATTRKTSVAEGENTKDFQASSETQSRFGRRRVSQDQKRQWNQFTTNSQSGASPEDEAFLTVVDREADQVVGWHGRGFQANIYKLITTKPLSRNR